MLVLKWLSEYYLMLMDTIGATGTYLLFNFLMIFNLKGGKKTK